MVRQGWLGDSQFEQTALDGFAMALEERGDVGDATVSEFESFDGGVEATMSFVE